MEIYVRTSLMNGYGVLWHHPEWLPSVGFK